MRDSFVGWLTEDGGPGLGLAAAGVPGVEDSGVHPGEAEGEQGGDRGEPDHADVAAVDVGVVAADGGVEGLDPDAPPVGVEQALDCQGSRWRSRWCGWRCTVTVIPQPQG